MRQVIIYGKNSCVFCEAAKLEAAKHGVKVSYRNVEEQPVFAREMAQYFPGATTVPQILNDETLEPIGGFLEFKRLLRTPKLLKG